MNRRRFFSLMLSAASGALSACRGRGSRPTPVATQQVVNIPIPTVAPVEPTPTATVAPTPSPSPTPTPMPTPTPAPALKAVGVWIEPGLSADLSSAAQNMLAALQQRGQARNLIVETIPEEEGADIRLTTQPLAGDQAITVARSPLALVTSLRVPLRGVSKEQATAIMAGTITNWSDVGSAKALALVSLVVGGDSSDPNRIATYEDLVSRFDSEPGAVALVPVADVDYRARTLSVDGIDILAHPEQAADYPLQQALHLEVTPDADASVASLVTDAEPSQPAPVVMAGHGSALTVSMVGDIILGRTVNTIMTRLNDFAAPFRLVADELKQSDLTIGDLECSLSDTITPPSDPYTFLFITSAAAVDGLTLAGIDGVSRANNHSMNFGVAGLHDTSAALDQAGITHFGMGDNLAEARKPGLFEVKGTRLAFLGFDGITGGSYGATADSAGTSPLVVENLVADIAAARQQADLVIPYIHWGVEYTLEPTVEQRSIARRAIEAGADLVVGSHPHWVQGIEIYQSKPIIYSLANFVFDQDWSEETKQGLIMHLTFQGTKLVALRFVPVYIEDFYRPRIVDGAGQVTILDRLWTSTDAIRASVEP